METQWTEIVKNLKFAIRKKEAGKMNLVVNLMRVY